MKNSIITLAIIFMMAGYTGTLGQDNQAVAQKPDVPEVAPEFDIKIEGVAKSYAVGDLIEIDAVVTGANGKVKYDWKVRPEVNSQIWPDGSKILFGTGPKPTNFMIYLAVAALSDGAEPTQMLETRIETATITQEGELVEKPIPEDPAEQPKPPVLGQFGQLSKDLAKKIQITEFYTEGEFSDDAKLLAQNFQLIADNATNGQIDSLDAALAKTREFNRNFGNREVWADWFTGVSEQLVQANKDGKLTSTSDVAKVWKEIANGLSNL